MKTLIIKSNTNQTTSVLIKDFGGVEIPNGGGQLSFTQFDYLKDAQRSDDLLDYLTDDAHAPNGSTLILNDGVNDISSADALNYLALITVPYGDEKFGVIQTNSNIEIEKDLKFNATSGFFNLKIKNNLDANNFQITNAAAPSADDHVVNWGTLKAAIHGKDNKDSCRVKTIASLPTFTTAAGIITASANGPIVIDGITLAISDRILVTEDGSSNGIYEVTSTGSASAPFVLTRSIDADTSSDLTTGATVYVEEGTANHAKYSLLTPGNIVIDTTVQLWGMTDASGQRTAGIGLQDNGNALEAKAGNGIIVNAAGVNISYGASAMSIGNANASGSSMSVSRQDHVHAHGDQSAGTSTHHAATQISLTAALAELGGATNVQSALTNLNAILLEKTNGNLQYSLPNRVPANGFRHFQVGAVPLSSVPQSMIKDGKILGAVISVSDPDPTNSYLIEYKKNSSAWATLLTLNVNNDTASSAVLNIAYATNDKLQFRFNKQTAAANASLFDKAILTIQTQDD